MTTDKEIVVYNRSTGCAYWSIARRVLEKYGIPYREVLIDKDEEALQRLIDWTGFKSIPTIILANPGEDFPCEEPEALPRGQSPRGMDRGSMITEAGEAAFKDWLRKHGFIEE